MIIASIRKIANVTEHAGLFQELHHSCAVH
jgi:hypothetical protein